MTPAIHTDAFESAWQARLLPGPPLIAPTRSFVFPENIPGEEDALARGALFLEVRPASATPFLAQCALGFSGPGVAPGRWSAPDPPALLAGAGGYAYQIPTEHPQQTSLLSLRPVVSVHIAPETRLLILAGFHTVLVLGEDDLLWQAPRLTWEGLTITGIDGDLLHGLGWHMRTDRELPFTLNLRTRELTGGAFLP